MKHLLKIPLVFVLTCMARVALWRHSPTIIAITGSVGKTTTKDIIAYALQDVRDVRASRKSFNSDIGVPLSIFGLDNPYTSPILWLKVYISTVQQIFGQDFPDILVLEVGAGKPNDIKSVSWWLRPHISVFTQLAPDPVHLEFFESPEEIYQEKKYLARDTKSEGTVIYNGHDAILERVLDDIDRKKIPFDIPDHVRLTEEGTVITLLHKQDVVLRGSMAFHLRNTIGIVAAVADVLALDARQVFNSLENNYEPTPGRGRIIQGVKETLIIDDAYNASPVAVRAALSSFEKFETEGRKIFVFGDMMELGEIEVDAHTEVAQYCNYLDIVITVGTLSRHTYEALNTDHVETYHFETSDEAGEFLENFIATNDTLLFKASRHAIKMERAIARIVPKEEEHKLVQDYLQ